MADIRISAYTDKLSVKPGDTLQVMASADATETVRAELVRLIHGDEHPDGPGFVAQPVASPIDRAWPVRKQHIQKGNFLRVQDGDNKLAPTGPVTLHAFIFPTLPEAGRQMLLGRWLADATAGFGFGINPSGKLEFWVGDGTATDAVTAEVKLIARVWYFVAASYDPASGRATLYQETVINRYNSLLSKVVPYDYRSHVSETLRVRPTLPDEAGFVIGAAMERNPARGTFFSQCYNGKIDRFGILGGVLDRDALDALRDGGAPEAGRVLAYWDTTAGYTDRGIGDTVVDTGPSTLHAQGYNRPVRGQTGWNWNGRNDCFRLAPQEFGGIEFHADALIDCRWEPTLSLTIPPDLRSGVYAIRLTAGDGTGLAEEFVPFFVRART
ncbi:MAG: LamG domain-containing protein, partial [Alphaproteobacteria bacterium]|nr:LamG domain-containing protein [Alphaproteobacteria bacterium]